MVHLNLKWRKFKGLGELMRALNVCLDTKLMGTVRFSTSVGSLRSLRGSATSPSCQ